MNTVERLSAFESLYIILLNHEPFGKSKWKF